jgi:hypothetical protein
VEGNEALYDTETLLAWLVRLLAPIQVQEVQAPKPQLSVAEQLAAAEAVQKKNDAALVVSGHSRLPLMHVAVLRWAGLDCNQ